MTLVRVIAAVPGLETVTMLAAEVVDTVWLPNPSEVGLNVMPAVPVPVPVTFTICGEPGALSVKQMQVARLPATAGVNVTNTVH